MTTTTATPTMEELEVSTSDEFLDIYDDSPLGGRVIVVSSSPKSTMNFESCEDKAQDIRECLQLHSESCSGTVDLWELRQLAISPGGLLSPSLRQVGWPLLTGVSMASLEEASRGVSDDENIAEMMSEMMQNDIEKTIWNLEELVRQSQNGKESFWYASFIHAGNASGIASGTPLAPTAPPMVVSSPSSSSETSQTESQTIANSPQRSKPNPGPSAQDQILLRKVLTKALQGQTQYPVAGLSNLAALFMINLESTSLSSLLLIQLSTYPLKAAFSGANIDSIHAMMKCLLEKFQPKAIVDIQSKSEEALAWFSGGQAGNLQAASRLMDAFLVSHPLFPLYFGAAAVETSSSWNMEKVEELITKALEYMEQLPPAHLLKAVNQPHFLPSTPNWAVAATVTADWAPIHNGGIMGHPFTAENHGQQVEPFSDEDSTSSDWERLSAASQLETDEAPQNDNNTAQLAPTREILFHDSYPLAMTAAGLGMPSTRSRSLDLPALGESIGGGRRYMKFAFPITAIVAVLIAVLSQQHSGVPVSVATAPHTSPAPQSIMQRLVAYTRSLPRSLERPYQEKFLGLLPVQRPAPKTVLRTTITPQAREQRERPYQEKFLGLVPVERPAPKKVLRTMITPMGQRMAGQSKNMNKVLEQPSPKNEVSNRSLKAPVPPTAEEQLVVPPSPRAPVAAPSSPAPKPITKAERRQQPLVPSSPRAKLTIMVRKDEIMEHLNGTDATPESEKLLHQYIMDGLQTLGLDDYYNSSVKTLQAWSSSSSVEKQQVAEQKVVETPVRKFQPLRPMKKQLKKVGNQVGKLWSKVVTFVRRRIGGGRTKRTTTR